MTELDELERDLMQAADVWFAQVLHQKLQRLIVIARAGEGDKLPELRETVAPRAQLRFDAEHDLGV